MLRRSYHNEVTRLDRLKKAHNIVKDKEHNIRSKFNDKSIYLSEEESKELEEELDNVCEVEDFLTGEIAEHQSNTGLEVIYKQVGKSIDYRSLANSALFDICPDKDFSLYEKYKDDDRLYNLYSNSMSIYDQIFDLTYFGELIKYIDNGKLLKDVEEAKYEFSILDKEDEERREFNEYKIIITCDNDLILEIFANGTVSLDSTTVYSANYENSYVFNGFIINDIDNKFDLKKMMKTVATSGVENKKYKLYLKG